MIDIFGAIDAFFTFASTITKKAWPSTKEKSASLTLSSKSDALQVAKKLRKTSKKRKEKLDNAIR